MVKETYLDSPVNLIPLQAYRLILKRLRKERDPRNRIHFPTLDIDIETDRYNCYVDLGFHHDIHRFGRDLDKLYGIDRLSMIPPHLLGREYLEGGGITRVYGFSDKEKNLYCAWTTFYKRDLEDIINLFIKGHEEAHVAYGLNGKNALLEKLFEYYERLKNYDLNNESEELIVTLSAFMPLLDRNLNPQELIKNLSDYTVTVERELKKSIELVN